MGQKIFISLGDAAAMLLGAGLTVKLQERKVDQVAQPVKFLVAMIDGIEAEVAGGYRDGTTWRFKAEVVEYFVDEYRSMKLKARFYGFGEAPRAKADGYAKVHDTFFGTLGNLLKKYGEADVVFVESAKGDNDRFEWYVVARGEGDYRDLTAEQLKEEPSLGKMIDE